MSGNARRGIDSAVWVDGIDASSFIPDWDRDSKADDIETTVLKSKSKRYLASVPENTVKLSCYWDGDESSLDELLDATFGGGGNNIITLFPGGDIVGKAAYLSTGTQVTYKTSGAQDKAVEGEAEFRSERVRGRVLKGPGVLTATTTGTTITQIIGATTKGGKANLHVPVLTGAPTSCVIIVEHSVDGSTWATLLSFDVTAQTVPTGYEASTLDTATVNGKLRYKITITGGTTPTIDFVITFGRYR